MSMFDCIDGSEIAHQKCGARRVVGLSYYQTLRLNAVLRQQGHPGGINFTDVCIVVETPLHVNEICGR